MKQCQMWVKLICVVLILLQAKARGLKFVLLDVPPAADIFSPVTLRCEYDLEGRNLYSVKWYKDGSEFFTYMPDYKPESRAVKTSGIAVDKSDMNKVTVSKLQFNNSGNYKCEVSTEGPNFETVARSSNMTVMAYPSENPMIEGILSSYSIGDQVSANCTSGKSNPLANLTWYINGMKPEKKVKWGDVNYLLFAKDFESVNPPLNAVHMADSWVWEYPQGPDETDSQGLHTKTVGLQFQILNTHFVNNGGFSPKVEIRCTSIVGESVRHMSVYPKLVRALTSNKLAQERNFNSAGHLKLSTLTIISLLIASLRMVNISWR